VKGRQGRHTLKEGRNGDEILNARVAKRPYKKNDAVKTRSNSYISGVEGNRLAGKASSRHSAGGDREQKNRNRRCSGEEDQLRWQEKGHPLGRLRNLREARGEGNSKTCY